VTLRTIGVRLTAEIGDYQAKLKAASQSTRDFKGELDKAAKGGHLDKVADTAGVVGLGLLGMAGAAVKSAADFDKAMSAVEAATHAPAAQIEALRAAAIKAGKDTQYSATEAADGITELSKAGISAADVLRGGLKGALALAAAGQLSVGEAAETAASALTQFKLQGKDVPHVADLLAAGAGKAQGSVHDMGYALSQSGLVAAQFGLSIEDTVGGLAEFANAGLIGSDAGTSFKTMLLALSNPSELTSKHMDALGISFYDAQGKFIGLGGVAEVLRRQLGGLTDEQRQGTLAQIFGNDAVRAASILYADGAAGVTKWKNAVNDSGYASETAAKLTDNLSGDVERLKGSFETLAIQSGGGANSGLRLFAKGLNAIVNQIGAMSPATSGTLVVLAGLTGVLLVGGAAWVKYRKFVADAQAQLIATGPAGEKAAVGLGRVTSVLGKVGLWAAAAEAAATLFNSLDQKSVDVDRLTASLENLGKTGQSAGALNEDFGKNFDKLGRIAEFADSADHGFGNFVNKVAATTWVFGDAGKAIGNFGSRLIAGTDFDTATKQMAGLDQALTSYMTTTNDAQKSSDLWNKVLSQSGLNTDQLVKLLPNAYAEVGKLNAAAEKGKGAVGGLGNATKGASGKLGDLKSALDIGAAAQEKYKTVAAAVAAAAHGERDALSALSKQLKAETDPVFALISAQQGMRDAQAAATKAVKEHGAKSKEARAADVELAKAAIDLQGATGNLGNSFNGKLTPAMRDTLKAAGLTKSEINAVAGQFRDAKKDGDKFAKKYEAQTSAPGAKQAKKDLDLAYTSANGFAGPYVARVSVTGDKAVNSKLNALLVKQYALAKGLSPSAAAASVQKDLDRDRQHAYATGGQVGGWSPHSRADNIPAWLTANEWVHPVDSVKYYGPQVMAAIQHRQVPREMLAAFASGELGKMGDLPIGLASGGQVPLRFVTDASRTRIPSWSEVLSHIPGGAASSFLHAQDGKPYVWASAGPGGYDCSGIASAVYELLHGRSPYRHVFSTGGLPGGWFPKRGVGGPLTVAWSNPGEAPASSTTGHMMGMAGGLTFESTGGRGVHLGASTRRLTDFAHIAHYAQGGPVGRHTAMKHGGIIPEHVVGVGRSGRTYEFGELGPERVTPLRGYATGGLVNVARSTSTSGSRLDTADAMLSAANAVAQLTAALKANGRSWSTATQKGRDNRAALIAGVKAAQDAAKAKYDETGSIKAANRVYDEYLHKLDESMKKMHVNAKTRHDLIKAYSERPKYDTSTAAPSNSGDLIKATTDHIGIEDSLQSFRGAVAWTKPTFNLHTEAGRSELSSLFGFLNAASSGAQSMYEYTGNAKQATAYYQGYIKQLRDILIKSGMSAKDADALIKRYGRITLTPKSNRWGGLYEHAATGSLRDAQIAAGGPTQYAWAESSTGGELFAPKNGNLQKTRQEVGWAVANWWGGNVNWGGQGGGKNVTVQATIPITLGADTITQQVRMEIDTALGQVVNAIVYQTA
jgi:TP901 family phage tail tape measure protein